MHNENVNNLISLFYLKNVWNERHIHQLLTAVTGAKAWKSRSVPCSTKHLSPQQYYVEYLRKGLFNTAAISNSDNIRRMQSKHEALIYSNLLTKINMRTVAYFTSLNYNKTCPEPTHTQSPRCLSIGEQHILSPHTRYTAWYPVDNTDRQKDRQLDRQNFL